MSHQWLDTTLRLNRPDGARSHGAEWKGRLHCSRCALFDEYPALTNATSPSGKRVQRDHLRYHHGYRDLGWNAHSDRRRDDCPGRQAHYPSGRHYHLPQWDISGCPRQPLRRRRLVRQQQQCQPLDADNPQVGRTAQLECQWRVLRHVRGQPRNLDRRPILQ